MSTERTVSTTTTVPAAPEAVWSLLSDPARLSEWADHALEVTSADSPWRLGSNYEQRTKPVGPMRGASRWTVVEHEEPRRQTHRGEGAAQAKALDFVIELRPVERATEVTLGLRYRPALGAVGRVLDSLYFRRSLERSLKRTAANLAALVERERAS